MDNTVEVAVVDSDATKRPAILAVLGDPGL